MQIKPHSYCGVDVAGKDEYYTQIHPPITLTLNMIDILNLPNAARSSIVTYKKHYLKEKNNKSGRLSVIIDLDFNLRI
jgi:hypothetical protein